MDKIELITKPKVNVLLDILDAAVIKDIENVITLYKELQSAITQYVDLNAKRREIAEAADEYLTSKLQNITSNQNRLFLVRGIESEMSTLYIQMKDIIKQIDKIILP